MPEKTTIAVRNAVLEPTSVAKVEAKAAIDVSADSLKVGMIEGGARLESILRQGVLHFVFSPHFDWGISLALEEQGASTTELEERLREFGLTDEQVKQTVGLIEQGLEAAVFDATPAVPVTSDDGWVIRTGELETRPPDVAAKPGVESKFDLAIPLPNIPLNLSPSIAVADAELKDIRINSGDGAEVVGSIETGPIAFGDFDVETASAPSLHFEQVEAKQLRIDPMHIGRLNLGDITTHPEIPQLGVSSLPIHIDAGPGNAAVSVQLVDWKPRWRNKLCIDVWIYKKCIWIEYGINVKLYLTYNWLLSLLKVDLTLKNVFLRGIKATIRISEITLSKISLGLLKVASLMCRRLSAH